MRVIVKQLWENTFRVNIWEDKPLLEDSTVRVEQICGSYFIKTTPDGKISESRPTAPEDHHKIIENKIRASNAKKSTPDDVFVIQDEPACV